MTTLPPPPIPPEVDLRDFDYMPLYGGRLFSSDTWIMASPEGRCAALKLWWESWRQEPCGSLPDNDRLLANLAGYGIAVPAFLKIKEEAMRGWFKASDGRLYHLVVCEIAMKAWEGKTRNEAGNAAERERKRRKKDGGSTPVPHAVPPEKRKIPAENGEIPAEPAPFSAGKEANSGDDGTGIPPENALKGIEEEVEVEKKAIAAQQSSFSPSARSQERTQEQDETRRASALTAEFDAVIAEVWGQSQRRPWPAGTDIGLALRWLQAGITTDLVRAVAEPRCRKAHAAGKPPPRTLSFLEGAMDDTLAEAARSGQPLPSAAPVDADQEAAAQAYSAAMTRWANDGREGPAPKPDDFGWAPRKDAA